MNKKNVITKIFWVAYFIAILAIGTILGIATGTVLAPVLENWFTLEEVDYALVIDGELEDDYLAGFIIKSKIYDFSYKIIKPLQNMDDYLIKNLIVCAAGDLDYLTFNEQDYNRTELYDWIKAIDPINLILDVDYGHDFRPLIGLMNVYASSNITLKVELLQNSYDYRWSFLGSWLKNSDLDLEKTMFDVIIDGLIYRKSTIGDTGIEFWKGSQGTFINYQSV